MSDKFIIDGKYDDNDKIVIRNKEGEVVAKVNNLDTLYVWLEDNSSKEVV